MFNKRFSFYSSIVFFFFLILSSFFNISCNSNSPLVVWTDRPEIVSYVEFFNVTQNSSKVIVVYKENLANELPPAKDEKRPDILIGSLLKNSRVKKNFIPLDGVLSKNQVNAYEMYGSLMNYGNVSGKQYLLPVSFNVPMVIFAADKSPVLSESNLLDFQKLEEKAAVFNKRNSHEIYVNMGFGPSWNSEFLYEYVKSHDADIQEKGNAFIWNYEKMEESIQSLKKWTSEKNTSTGSEQDFSFKYLYTPVHKQVLSEKCFFAYTTSDKFFYLSPDQINNIDFRWLSNNGKVFVEDEIVTLGIYRKCYEIEKAYEFISWLLNETTQKNLLERSSHMQLDTVPFGICSGFSSIKSVNERVFPAYYKNLLGNLPDDEELSSPQSLPRRWESLKERVLIPYLSDASKTDSATAVKTIDERLVAWRKQFN